LDKCPDEFVNKVRNFASAEYLEDLDKGDLKSLGKLHRNVIKAIEDYERAHWSLNESLKEAIWLEDIENTSGNTFSSNVGGFLMKFGFYRAFIWYWETKLNPIFCFTMFIITTIFSVVIVFGEVSIFFFKSNTSVIRNMFVQNFSSFFMTTVVIMLPLCYL
jgi:hypothetical protein